MKAEIVVPKMGESVSSGIVAAWLKESGDAVAEGDELFELETDKATLAIPSTAAGVLERKAAEGDEVKVGQVVAYVSTDIAPATAAKPSKEEAATAIAPAPAPATSASVSLSPAARRIVEEHRLDAGTITGSGKGGLITKEDALDALERSLVERSANQPQQFGPGVAPSPAPGSAKEAQTRVPMSTLRKRIAENLVLSQQTSAHLTTFNEIDMSAVMDMRKQYRDAFEKKHGVRLGFMSFFVKASAAALAEFPAANGAIEGSEIVYNNHYNVGVAVSTERGLIVPVVRDADQKNFAEIEAEIVSFATRAKDKKIAPDELSGGTFSITNGGVFGSLLSTPIPTPGQSAILGMHAIQKRPVVVDEQIVARPMMYVAVTYDHRIMDGREAVSFLVRIKQLVEDPKQLLLGL